MAKKAAIGGVNKTGAEAKAPSNGVDRAAPSPPPQESAGFGQIDRAIQKGLKKRSTFRPVANGGALGTTGANPDALLMAADSVLRTRELYWHNVVREMLNSLSILCQTKPELFDGRFAVLTQAGERIAIERIFPLFACSIPNSPWELEASMAVQCTVYRIITPEGEVFTLPLHEIRGMHSLTPALVEQLQKVAEAQAASEEGDDDESEKSSRPFGLAAFTSLPRPVPPFGPRGPEGLEEPSAP